MASHLLLEGFPDSGWRRLMQFQPSVVVLFACYVLPLSLIPPAMMYYAAVTYGGRLLPAISPGGLPAMFMAFLLSELAMVPAMAWVIQQLGAVVQVRRPYHDAFALAAMAPTPLWLAPLSLFVPSAAFSVAAGAIAMLVSAGLIFRIIDPVFDLDEPGQALLLGSSILAAGLVAWIVMIGLALVAWGSVIA